MKKTVKNILNEKLILLNIKNNEFYKNILKGLTQNNNIKVSIKIYAYYILYKKKKKNLFSSKKHKICLYTGRRAGLFKNFSFSRIKLKDLIKNNKYPNIKKHNW